MLTSSGIAISLANGRNVNLETLEHGIREGLEGTIGFKACGEAVG